MIHGVGVDLIDERRLGPLADPLTDPFITKVYTGAEQAEALASRNPRRYYAERFAAKEALFKALRISGEGVRLNEIETLNDEHGAPFIRLYGSLEQRARELGIAAIHVSLSNDPPYSTAFVVCEK